MYPPCHLDLLSAAFCISTSLSDVYVSRTVCYPYFTAFVLKDYYLHVFHISHTPTPTDTRPYTDNLKPSEFYLCPVVVINTAFSTDIEL